MDKRPKQLTPKKPRRRKLVKLSLPRWPINATGATMTTNLENAIKRYLDAVQATNISFRQHQIACSLCQLTFTAPPTPTPKLHNFQPAQ